MSDRTRKIPSYVITNRDEQQNIKGSITFGNANSNNVAEFDRRGQLSLSGKARVLKGVWVPFNALKAPGTKPATFKEWGISGVWEFSDATDDTIVFNLPVPLDMDRSIAPYIQIGWSTNTAVVTETATWQLEYLYREPGEDTTATAQGTLSANSNAAATADGMVVADIAGMDLPSGNDVCTHFRLKRLGAGGSDDLTDTAELHGVCFRYVADKLGTPI